MQDHELVCYQLGCRDWGTRSGIGKWFAEIKLFGSHTRSYG